MTAACPLRVTNSSVALVAKYEKTSPIERDGALVSTERALQRRVLTYLRSLKNSFWANISPGPYSAAGLPDIIGCRFGRFYGIELKQPGKYHPPSKGLTAAQIWMSAGIEAADGRWLCTDNVEDVMHMFEEAENPTRSDDEEDVRPLLDEGGDLDAADDDPALLFNDPPCDDE